MAAYRVLENMPNFNHNNPFVITCSERRRSVNTALLDTTKRGLSSTLAVFALFIFVTIYSSISIVNCEIHLLSPIYRSQFIVLLFYLAVDWIQFFRDCLQTSVYRDVDELLAAESSEVLNINIEQVLDAEKRLCEIYGTIQVYKKGFRKILLLAILLTLEVVLINGVALLLL